MLRVGLTGGIACGKSHVLRRLAARGCWTLDLDRVAHGLMAPGGAAHRDVVASFGEGILAPDGSIDRKKLGATVFADAAARQRLNGLIHPHVRGEEERLVEAAVGGQAAAVAVTDAALLVESGVHLRFDRLVVVHCAPPVQLRRLMSRDRLSQADAEARIRAQMPLALKRAFANIEVETSGDHADTDTAADALAERLQALAREASEPRVVARRRLLGALLATPASALPQRLLDEVSSSRGLEMVKLGSWLGRQGESWWAANGEGAAVPPADLIAPAVAFVLARRGADYDLLGLVAMSLARAVTGVAAEVALACATAHLMASAELAGLGQPREPEIAAAEAFGQRWGGSAVRLDLPFGGSHRALAGWLAAEDEHGPPELAAAVGRFLVAAKGLAGG